MRVTASEKIEFLKESLDLEKEKKDVALAALTGHLSGVLSDLGSVGSLIGRYFGNRFVLFTRSS